MNENFKIAPGKQMSKNYLQFYGASDLVTILGVSRTKAYEIIRDLIADLEAMGKLSPKAGKIQKSYFCERFMLSPEECDELLTSNQKQTV